MRSIIFILVISFNVFAQTLDYVPGEITYKTTQHIYVRFENFDRLEVGDSLFFLDNISYRFGGIVKYLSSTSCAVESRIDFKVGDKLFRKYIPEIEKNIRPIEVLTESTIFDSNEEIKIQETTPVLSKRESKFYGRIGITSYSNLTNQSGSINTQRWKYLSSLNYDYVGGSNFSLTSYMVFVYRTHEWVKVQDNLMNALKIYNLALKYDFSEKTNIWFGRRINSNLSNIGTIDGFQFESETKAFNYGIVVGSRPHFTDYGFNAKLFEYGGYIARTDSFDNKYIRNSLAMFQQTNNFKTDRRFIYLQHNNNIIDNVNIFLSTEIDLYKREKGEAKSTFNLTGFYFLARYSPVRFVSVSASYDARKNVVFYETFKSVADSILASETRQGVRLSVTLRPINYLIFNFSGGYRFRPDDIKPTRNFNGSISYTKVPIINSSVSVNGSFFQTSYLDGKIIGMRIYKDLFSGMLNLSLGYRNLLYKFDSNIPDQTQNIFETNFSFRITDSIYCNLSYEGVFQHKESYGRVFVNLTKRFR